MSNIWIPGPINNLNLEAMDDHNVGLEACWYGSFYSDAAYKHSPVPGQGPATGNSSDQTVGIHLWYAVNSTAFNAVGWTYGDTVWSEQQTFDGYNGHAGVGCYSWGPGSNTYVFFINLQDEVNILWKDLNTTTADNSTHPINTWTKSESILYPLNNTSSQDQQATYRSPSSRTAQWATQITSTPKTPIFLSGATTSAGPPKTLLSLRTAPSSSMATRAYQGRICRLRRYRIRAVEIACWRFIRQTGLI